MLEDGTLLIFVLQNTIATMGQDDPPLPFEFKFPLQSKTILMKSNMINQMTYQVREQMKNNMQVKVINQFGFGYQIEM